MNYHEYFLAKPILTQSLNIKLQDNQAGAE